MLKSKALLKKLSRASQSRKRLFILTRHFWNVISPQKLKSLNNLLILLLRLLKETDKLTLLTFKALLMKKDKTQETTGDLKALNLKVHIL